MCGITGFYGFEDQELLKGMTKKLIQLILFGLLGELQVKTYYSDKRGYEIEKVIGWDLEI